MAEITITPTDNGPYLVEGLFKLLDGSGTTFQTVGAHIALCRCGASSTKPLCDGTHLKIKFQSVVRVGKQALVEPVVAAPVAPPAVEPALVASAIFVGPALTEDKPAAPALFYDAVRKSLQIFRQPK